VNWLSKEILFYLSGESDGDEGENGAKTRKDWPFTDIDKDPLGHN
jgi:hypothetical protein